MSCHTRSQQLLWTTASHLLIPDTQKCADPEKVTNSTAPGRSLQVLTNNHLQAGIFLFILESKVQWDKKDVLTLWLVVEGPLLKRLSNEIQCTTEAPKKGFKDFHFACGHQ